MVSGGNKIIYNMITSNQIIKISEDWFGSIKANLGSSIVDIYSNPGSGDYREMSKAGIKNIRFLAVDNIKTIYVWDSIKAIHKEVANFLGGNIASSYNNDQKGILASNASLSGGKPNYIHADTISFALEELRQTRPRADIVKSDAKLMKNIFKFNWKWVDSYVTGTSSNISESKRFYETLMRRYQESQKLL